MENLNEDFKVLNELLRTAYKLISPISYHDDIKRLTPEFLKRDSVKTPGCYLAIGDGNNNTIFPIFNRYGFRDPDIIKFSLKMAKKMAEVDHVNNPNLPGTIIKLEKLLNKYNKPIPKPISQAILKAKATKSFNSKMLLNDIIKKNNVEEGVDLFALHSIYQVIRNLVVQFKQETDIEKKKEIQNKIVKQKQKIAKIKEKK